MFSELINYKKLHENLRDTYKRQMEIKKEFPHRFEYPHFRYGFRAIYEKELEARRSWQKARQEFERLSTRMTYLCCILAHSKGKLHMKKLTKRAERYGRDEREVMTLKDQAVFIASRWEKYIVEEESVAA